MNETASMSSKRETTTYFGQCRCCLNYGYLKNMWTHYQIEGNVVMYGEMLIDCFALSWDATEETMKMDQICIGCIARLQDASNFKQLVLKSQEQLLKECNDVIPPTSRLTNETDEDIKSTGVDTQSTGIDTQTTGVDIELKNDENQYTEEMEVQNEMEYEEVEYLEEDIVVKGETKEEKPVRTTKWPKKLPKSERYKSYKQYTDEDLRKAVEGTKAGMSIREACRRYSIPRNALHAKLKEPDDLPEQSEAPFDKLVKDIKAVLTYTNATPFKSKTNKYYCAYCGTDGDNFEDPVDLRVHTRTAHAAERIKQIELFMRPHYFNEILRVDIENLICNVCCIPITSWNEMFRHLQDAHNTKLDQACTRVIPYNLQADIRCALCKQVFTTYMHLDVHMNTHYNNYMCRKCGDIFVTSNRLKNHEKSHEIGEYSCSYCNKVFTMEKYKRKHENLFHKKLSQTKCQYCDEKFLGEFKRHNHILEKHKDKVKIITCELCGKTFTMKCNYTAHMRKCHSESKFYECDECGETFKLKRFLTEHKKLTHRIRKYSCETCGLTYTKLNVFRKHVKSHETGTVNRKSSMTSRQ